MIEIATQVLKRFSVLAAIVLALAVPGFSYVSEEVQPDTLQADSTHDNLSEAADSLEVAGEEEGHSGKFQPGPFIMDHIADSYEWHVTSFGETHVSIPLPVILYTSEKGISVFMSSHFHHGHEAYEGFFISHEEKYKGKIVYLNPAGEEVRPIDLSITKNVTGLFISMILMLWIFLSIAKSYKTRAGKAPKGLQNLLEPLIIFIRDDVARSSIGEKHYMRFMPYLLTIFWLIFINNLLGLVPIFPGGANVTGNIAVTLVFALITFIITSINGKRAYWAHVFWPPVPHALKPLMIPIEIIGVFIKPFVLMVRLFANITAGHIIALGFFSLIFIFGGIHAGAGYGVSVVTIVFTVFMTMLELLVAFIQAYVFTFLSALYFGMAVEEHHH